MTQFVKFFLSGGAANTVAADSLGGAQSATEVGMGAIAWTSSATAGITLVGSYNMDTSYSINQAWVGYSLTYSVLKMSTDYGVIETGGIPPNGDGRYILHDIAGTAAVAVVDIVVASLATQYNGIGTTSSYNNNLFNDVTDFEATFGAVKYRCIYLQTNDSVERLLTAYIGSQIIDSESIAIGFTQTVGGFSESTLVDETIEPPGIIEWSTATDIASGISATVAAGQSIGLWIRQTVTPLNNLPWHTKNPKIEIVLT